ncbi:MAG: LPS assembly lipoprotein LptE [Bacteroidales bacterium]|nr:LPS assembly lipoprotein LptE [Bacteroidales bacterium]
MKTRLAILSLVCLALSGCGIYSFTGTSIQPDVKSISIELFEYKAAKVNPSLANDLTEEIRTRFRRMTSLEQVEENGDLTITGAVTGYDVKASAISANDVAAQNRLTVSVSVSFADRLHPEEDFTNKTFSAYSDYDSENSLDAVESSLCAEIIDKLVEDIFNATVAQW